jgi:hypothetical protein
MSKRSLFFAETPLPIDIPWTRVTVTLPESVALRVKDLAKAQRTSMAAIVAQAVVAAHGGGDAADRR